MAKKAQKSSRLNARLSVARGMLQEFAEFFSWATSGKQYLNIEQYQELRQREITKEERARLRYLKQQKLIEMRKICKRLCYRLTEKGWTQALRDKIKTSKAQCSDGKCFVIFDIPEKERAMRNMLRQFLKESGFIRLQHSVWVTDRDVVEPLRQLLQRKKLERWIRIVVGKIVAASPLDRLVIRQNYKT